MQGTSKSTWTTVFSCKLDSSPITTGASSPRICTPANTLASRPMVTSPTMPADGAMRAVGWAFTRWYRGVSSEVMGVSLCARVRCPSIIANLGARGYRQIMAIGWSALPLKPAYDCRCCQTSCATLYCKRYNEPHEGKGCATMPEMISLEEARALVLSHAAPLPVETVPVLEAVGCVAAADLKSDIDISPFAHSAMDGFAVRAAELAEALAGSAQVGGTGRRGRDRGGRRVRRLYRGRAVRAHHDRRAHARRRRLRGEIRDRRRGDRRRRARRRAWRSPPPPAVRSNVREAGEEAKAGETVVSKGEVIGSAGVGFLAGCGMVEVRHASASARGHYLHRLGVGGSRGRAHARQDPQLEQLRACRLRASSGCGARYPSHRGGYEGGACGGGVRGGGRVPTSS